MSGAHRDAMHGALTAGLFVALLSLIVAIVSLAIADQARNQVAARVGAELARQNCKVLNVSSTRLLLTCKATPAPHESSGGQSSGH